MDMQHSYKVFSTPSLGLDSPANRRLLPLVWPAAAVDNVAINLMRCFFFGQQRPHYRQLPDGFAAAAEIYASPALQADPGLFFRPPQGPHDAQVRPVDHVPGGQRFDVAFTSTYRTYFEAFHEEYNSLPGNERVHARLWRHDGAPRPTVLCIHGWGGGHIWFEEQIFAAAQLFSAGLNVLIMVQPFHGARRPRGHHDLNLFPGSDFRRTNEAFGQAVADARMLMQWVRASGAATGVGVMGMSLGGYVAALLASLEPAVDFAVPVITPVSLGDLLWNLELDSAGRAVAEAAGFGVENFRAAMSVHCPLHHTLKIPRERVLIVGGRADRVVPAQHVLALWEHWGQPKLRWFPGGHCMHFGRGGYLRDLLDLAQGVTSEGHEPQKNLLRRWLAPVGRASSS